MKIIFFIIFILQFFLPVTTLCQSRASWPVRSQNGMVATSDGIASKVGAERLGKKVSVKVSGKCKEAECK